MELMLTLALPHDVLSIPVVRQVLRRSMAALGVEDDTGHDVETAVSEACTNVLTHSRDGDEYEVVCRVLADRCVITVADRGHGFDAATQGLADADTGAEGGRGIQLMRALVDEIHFEHCPDDGMVVRLEKHLSWTSSAPATRLAGARPAG